MKILIGWVLIISGILLVLGTIYSTYLNFTGQNDFPQIFTVQEAEVVSNAGGGLEDQIGSMIREYIKELVPQDTTIKMFNMIAWITFATFLVFSGSKLVGMGGTLLKVSRKEEE